MKLLAFAASMFLASEAAALSCVRPDVARSFLNAAESEKRYSVLLGRFTFQQPPQTRQRVVAPRPHSVTATFSGSALGVDGFAPTSINSVMLDFTCAASWCGSMQSGTEVLAFVERDAGGYRLTVTACGGWAFESPSAEDVARVEACMAGQGCAPEPDRHRR